MKHRYLIAVACCLASPAKAEPLTILFAGDIMLADGPGRLIAAGGDPFAPFAATLAAADYRIGNLECAVATGGAAQASKLWSFRAHPETLKVLRGRFDAVSLANNHSGDFGPLALLETRRHLDAAGIAHFGSGPDLSEAHRPLWIDKKGLKIAVLGYNEYKPRRFEAGPQTPGIAWSEDEQVIADIRTAKAAGADHVIPFMHWGWEKNTQPDERQRQFARRLIDEGASLVIGSHPHVTQGTEIYRGKPIIYSLGNFVFDGFNYENGRRGWLLRLQIDRDGVRHWETLAADLDHDGTPLPAPGRATPCGSREDDTVAQCLNP